MTNDPEIALQREEPRYAPTVERVYRNEHVEVTWEPSFCIHVAACLRGAPAVFDAQRRPWVDVDGDTPERILDVVEQCPTGALHARRLDAPPPPPSPDGPVEVSPRRNGPLFLRGPVRLYDRRGDLLREDTRVALCRCGASENKPFCDGSHARVGFESRDL